MHWRKRAASRRKLARVTRHRLFCERLEPRLPLASDGGLEVLPLDKQEPAGSLKWAAALESQLVAMAPTHAYRVDGQPVSLVVHPAKLALKVAAGVRPQSLLNLGLEFQRDLGPGYGLYESTDGLAINRTGLMATGLIEDAVSVFFAQQSRSDAVLLDEIVVALKPGVAATEYFKNNALFVSYRPLLGTHDQFVATVAAGKGEAALSVVNRLDADPSLTFVAPNFYQSWQKFFMPNDPRLANQWHLHNTGQGGGLVDADVDMPEAWDLIAGNSPSFKIGVVDDGVDAHPDLNLWTNPADIPDGIDNDGNGWIDDFHGWNFVANNNLSGSTAAEDRHGTSVAGVAAARGNNALGVVGAGYNASVISARIFEGNNVASDANIAAALYYMGGRTANGLGTWASADIVNNSWGAGASNAVINAALTWGTTHGRSGRGTPYLFATGNEFGAVGEPALQSLNIPGVFAIGATNNKGTRANYSNFGPAVDMVAPSSDTRAGYLAIDTLDRTGVNGYAAGDYTGTGATGFGGTSSATPLATGITSLVMARADALGIVLTPAQLRSYMRMQTDYLANATFDPLTGKNLEYGFGRINAHRAVSNLGKAELSVLSAKEELVNGATVAIDPVVVGEFVDTIIRIRNQGTRPLVLSSLNLGSGDFSLARPPAATTLEIGQATTFTVRFSPTAGGVRRQTVTIASNDADEGTFTFTVSGTGIAPTVSGVVFEDWDGAKVRDAFEATQPNVVVYADTNGNGALDVQPNSFSNRTRIALVDMGITTSTLTVTGIATPIFDLDVRINLEHSFASDLEITLISPSGTRVVLASRVGGGTDHFTNTIFDDEASLTIASGAAPRTGRFRPTQPLTAFDMQAANGTWTLEIADLSASDTGTLLNWDITISTAEPFAVSRASGAFGFLNLPVGSYSLRAVPPEGWSSTVALAVVVASPSDSLVGYNFGISKNNRFYGFVFDDADNDGIWDSTESPATGRTLLDDVNGNGVLDQATTTYTNSTPLTIPDLTTRTSTISVPNAGVVKDIDVRVNISMTFVADLDVFLIAPDGTRVELFTDVGGGGANFTNTVLDDQAATAITAGVTPFTGSFRPEGSLASLMGKATNGNWTLEISDDAGGDVATLNSWSLILTDGEFATPVPATGRLAMDMLFPGPRQVQLLTHDGWRYTQPTGGFRSVNVAGAPITDQRFGTRVNNRAPDVTVPNTTISVSEGSWLANSGTFSDADFGDVISFRASRGTIRSTGNTWQWSLRSATTDDVPATVVRITATDGQGGVTSKLFTYMVTNLAPVIRASSATVSGELFTTITNTGTWSDVAGDTVTLTASLGTIVKNANGTWNWSLTPTTAFAAETVTITAADEDGGVSTTSFTVASFTAIPSTSAYYKGSFYSQGGANVAAALDTSKSLVRAGATATTVTAANVTNYSRGINGVVIDMVGLKATSLTTADFTFKMSPQGPYNEANNPPSNWPSAPAPSSITVTAATPGPNSSRVRIEWPDNAIQDRWLQIRVLANANTGLGGTATYYLGNLRGDIDGLIVGGLMTVRNADLLAALPVGAVGSVTSPRDVDRNGFILNSDFVQIRNSINAGLVLRAITIPAAGSPQEASALPAIQGGLQPGATAAALIVSPSAAEKATIDPAQAHGTGAIPASSRMPSSPVPASSTAAAEIKPPQVVAAPAITRSSPKKALLVDAVFEQLGNQL